MAGPWHDIQLADDLFFLVLPALLCSALALLVLVLLLLLTLALRVALLLLLALLARILLILLILLVLLRVLVGTHLCISGMRQRNDAGGCTLDAMRLPARALPAIMRRRHRHLGKQFRTQPRTSTPVSHAHGGYRARAAA